MAFFSQKIRQVFFPYLAIALITSVGITAARWLLSINSDIVKHSDVVWEIYVPIFVCLPLLLIWLLPRIMRLGDIVEGKPGERFSFFVAAGFTIILSNGLLQGYVSVSTGALTECSVKDINNAKLTKYYQVEEYNCNSNYYGVFKRTYETNKGRDIECELYYVAPMFAEKDKDFKQAKAWYCLLLSKTIDNRTFSGKNIEEQIAAFYATASDSIRRINYHKNNFFENLTSFNNTKFYQKAISDFKTTNWGVNSPEKEIVLVPMRWSYAYRDPYYLQLWAGFVFFLGTLYVWFFIYTADYKKPKKKQ